MTFSIKDTEHDKSTYAECHDFLVVMLNVVILSVECRYAECRCAEWRYVECHGAALIHSKFIICE